MRPRSNSTMDADTKTPILGRLRRIVGQVGAIQRMAESDRDCVDVLLQIAAVRAALGRVGSLILGLVKDCASAALKSATSTDRQRKLDELVEVFDRYGNLGER